VILSTEMGRTAVTYVLYYVLIIVKVIIFSFFLFRQWIGSICTRSWVFYWQDLCRYGGRTSAILLGLLVAPSKKKKKKKKGV